MNTTETPTPAWLGVFHPHASHEVFPEGKLNAKQLHALLTLDDKQYGRITATYPSSQAIAQITDDIAEVHLSIGTSRHIGRQCTMWLDSRGRIVASAVVTGSDFRHPAESYWTMPDQLDKFGRNIITTTHENGMWSLGDYGAIPQTRKFIREHYTGAQS